MKDSLPPRGKPKLPRKLMILFAVGLVELTAFVVISAYQPAHLKVGNTYAFPIGSKKLTIQAPATAIVTTDREKLDSMGLQGYFIAIQNADSTQPAIVSVSVAGLVDSSDLPQIDSILRDDSSLEILDSRLKDDALDVEFINKNQGTKTVLAFRFLKVYPYILKVESAYNRDFVKPPFIDSVLNSIGVRR